MIDPEQTKLGRQISERLRAEQALCTFPLCRILMDCQMPEMDGVDATAEMLPVNRNPAVKAVAPRFSLFDTYVDIAFPGGIHDAWFTENWRRLNETLDLSGLPVLGSFRRARPPPGVHRVPTRTILSAPANSGRANTPTSCAFFSLTYNYAVGHSLLVSKKVPIRDRGAAHPAGGRPPDAGQRGVHRIPLEGPDRIRNLPQGLV